MSTPAISVSRLGKRYRIGEHHSFGSLRESVMTRLRALLRRTRAAPRPTIWALRDVSFEVPRGQAVGIIGSNGAGKSTLLRLLSRITEPTTGRIDIYGRVGSLLEVGTGFHPELTGRENIFLNGAILGMTRRDTRQRFDDIVAFAEVGEFLDTPVKRYSSGMYLRLAFAVAAHLEPDILLVDEILAVGDAAFQKRCLGKMGDVTRGGRTVLFVSHNMSAITALCERAIWVDRGQVRVDGPATAVVAEYLSHGLATAAGDAVIAPELHAHPPRGLRFDTVAVVAPNGAPGAQLFCGDPLRIDIGISADRRLEAVRLAVAVVRLDGTLVATLHHTDDPRHDLLGIEPGRTRITVTSPIRLMPGAYVVGLLAKRDPGYWGSGEESLDFVERARVFHVATITAAGAAPLPSGAVLWASSEWSVESGDG